MTGNRELMVEFQAGGGRARERKGGWEEAAKGGTGDLVMAEHLAHDKRCQLCSHVLLVEPCCKPIK